MAKRRSNQDGSGPQSKLRVFFAEVVGDDATIGEALRTVERMRQPVEVLPPQRKRISNETDPLDAADSLFNDPEADDAVEGQSVDRAAERAPANRPKRGEGPKRDCNAALTIVKDLDLRPAGKASLKQFVESKRPSSQAERIAVFTYYLKKVAEVPNVGYSHLYTCFDEVKAKKPGDLSKTARNTASRQGWIDTANSDDLKIATRGENMVEHDLPKAGGTDVDGK